MSSQLNTRLRREIERVAHKAEFLADWLTDNGFKATAGVDSVWEIISGYGATVGVACGSLEEIARLRALIRGEPTLDGCAAEFTGVRPTISILLGGEAC